MADEPQAPLPLKDDVHPLLHAIAELLRHPRGRLDASAQAALADLVDELDSALKAGEIPGAESARLAKAASHFAEAVHNEREAGVLTAARARLEEAALLAENRAPLVAGLARRVMDALANIGI